jgi:hypothetical protein
MSNINLSRVFVFFMLMLCLGCATKPKPAQINVSLIDSGRMVKITGLDYAIISEINRDSVTGIWQSLLPVFRMPADTDMKDYQPIQPGTYRLTDSAVVFKPDTPFEKGNTYFMRYYRFDKNDETLDFIRGKKKLNRMPYIDWVFK